MSIAVHVNVTPEKQWPNDEVTQHLITISQNCCHCKPHHWAMSAYCSINKVHTKCVDVELAEWKLTSSAIRIMSLCVIFSEDPFSSAMPSSLRYLQGGGRHDLSFKRWEIVYPWLRDHKKHRGRCEQVMNHVYVWNCIMFKRFNNINNMIQVYLPTC